MKSSLSFILRMLMWVAVGLSILAVGLGRYAPCTPPTYHAAAVRYHGVNVHCSTDHEPQPCFLDRQTGQILQLQFAKQDSLDYAVCSPWCDERGQFQAVARWMKRAGREHDYLPQEFGVARFTIPEGRLIDRVKLDHVPIGDPCWVPGVTPRIVFAAGDGNLYSYEFGESNPDLGGEAQECARTQPLAWRTALPGTGLLYIRDLMWPAEATLRGRLFASISYREYVDGKPLMTRPAIWWMQISEDATAIEAAGPLTAPEPGGDPGVDPGIEQRLPSIVATAEGDVALAYLSRHASHTPWELRVASITIDPATGVPTVGHGRSRGLAGGFLPSTPTFSADGRSVYGISNHDQMSGQLVARRFPVTDVLARAGGALRRPGHAGLEPASVGSSSVVPVTGILREPGSPRAESTLLGWANLGVFDPNWLVKMGVGRHAGE